VLGLQLDLIILKVFLNLNDPLILLPVNFHHSQKFNELSHLYTGILSLLWMLFGNYFLPFPSYFIFVYLLVNPLTYCLCSFDVLLKHNEFSPISLY